MPLSATQSSPNSCNDRIGLDFFLSALGKPIRPTPQLADYSLSAAILLLTLSNAASAKYDERTIGALAQ
jgi:hypothetical protein